MRKIFVLRTKGGGAHGATIIVAMQRKHFRSENTTVKSEEDGSASQT